METTHTDNAIDVRDLRKSYGDREAVRGVSFAVPRGEVFCLLGPNGAGKTTTTEILEGYRSRTSGAVSVLGLDPAGGPRELRERVGIVLQECAVQDDLTVAELLAMYGSYHRRRRPTGEVLELVELTGQERQRAKTLSGGQRRRLDLALALVGNPDLIFLDEPTTGFDPAARRHAWTTVKSLTELGKTVFLTTHYMDEAQALADRVAVISGGEIIAIGAPDELGGRRVRPAEIRFRLPDGRTASELPDCASATVRTDGDEVRLTTTVPLDTAHRITGWAIEQGLELPGFAVSQPTLEDIYLELTSTTDPEGAVR